MRLPLLRILFLFCDRAKEHGAKEVVEKLWKFFLIDDDMFSPRGTTNPVAQTRQTELRK